MARRKYQNATKDSRGNLWTEYTDEDGTTRRIPVRETADSEGNPSYIGYGDSADEYNTAGNGMYQASQLGGDAWRWQSGSPITPEEFQAMLQKLNDPRWTQGATGNMTQDQYLSDPRAAVRMENGQLVYRPEAAQGADWQPVDYRSQGLLGHLKEMMSYPGFQLAGLAAGGQGLFGGANPLLASTQTGGFLGDATAAGMGAGGAMPAAGGLTPGNMQWLNNSLAGEAPAGGMNVMGASAAPEVAAGSELFGGDAMINSLMNPGNGASWAELTKALGQSPLGAPGAIGTGMMGAGAATGLQSVLQGSQAVSGGGNWLTNFLDSILLPPTGVPGQGGNSGNNKSTQTNPWLVAGGALWDIFNQGKNKDMIKDTLMSNESMARLDPFGSQRGMYQGELARSYLDPNYWSSNNAFNSIGKSVENDLTRKLAAMGYSQSPGNMLGEIGSRLQDERMKYALGFQNQLGQLAGAGISPAEAGRQQAQGASMMLDQNTNQQRATGNFLGALPGIYGAVKGWLS